MTATLQYIDDTLPAFLLLLRSECCSHNNNNNNIDNNNNMRRFCCTLIAAFFSFLLFPSSIAATAAAAAATGQGREEPRRTDAAADGGGEGGGVVDGGVDDQYDLSCIFAFVMTGKTKDGCIKAKDTNGRPCLWCHLQGSSHICLNVDQMEMYSHQTGLECDDDEGVVDEGRGGTDNNSNSHGESLVRGLGRLRGAGGRSGAVAAAEENL